MKKNIKVLIAGLSIILLTNLVALGGVAYNRSGEPDALVQFTERELHITYQYGLERDSTGLSLKINCRVETLQQDFGYGNSNCWADPLWLDKKKLIELGFEFKAYDKNKNYRYYERALPKDVYLVLEYDGEVHQRVLQRAEQHLAEEQVLKTNNPDNPEFEERVKRASEMLQAEQIYNSRLFAIDAGEDKEILRNTYPEKDRYILMKASIKPTWRFNNNQRIWTGRISDLLVEGINVPLEHRAVLRPIEKAGSRRNRNTDGPRYAVQVAFGKRAEPWIVEVEAIDHQ